MKHVPLAEWIDVDRDVARSINLERDAKDLKTLQRFQLTNMALTTLRRFADSLDGEPIRAWSLTGPYGSGKSSFCNFLLGLMAGSTEARTICLDKITQSDNELGARLAVHSHTTGARPPMVGLRAVSRYEPLNSTLARGAMAAISSLGRERHDDWLCLVQQAEQLSSQSWPSTSDVIDLYRTLAQAAEQPLLIVVDEFGKNLEYQAHHPHRGDIYALQALAESDSAYVWVSLHQAFGAYSSGLSRLQREEWQKVQGRFEDRAYIEPPSRSFSLVTESLSAKPPSPAHDRALDKWATAMASAMTRLHLPDIPHMDEREVRRLYPFHPLAAYLIGELSRRFAQNDRTIFSFLSSGEPKAFADCLSRIHSDSPSKLPTLGLDSLYDYFSTNGTLKYAGRSENQRWIEIHTIISSLRQAGHERLRLLKTVGLLNLLTSLPGIVASEEAIHAALASNYYGNRQDVERLLREFVSGGTILYRAYADEYRLWEGSDFDLDREVLGARTRVALRPVSQTLKDIAPRAGVVAARHYVTTGTLREFEVRWLSTEELESAPETVDTRSTRDGTILLVLGQGEPSEQVKRLAENGSPTIVGYAACLSQVRDLMIEAAATAAACNAPQLARDGVAKKEARYRAATASKALSTFLDDAFSPSSQDVAWFVNGEERQVSGHRGLSFLISQVCDEVYRLCPPIDNEILNVDQLSSAAAAARNKLGEALANNPGLESLGMEGFGPEVAMYRSVIRQPGLHRKTEDSRWELAAPSETSQPNFAAVWSEIDRMLSGSSPNDTEPVPVPAILARLQNRPFGLRAGPAPLLLSHYLLFKADEVAVYQDGVYCPFFGDAEVTLLMRRPELFSLRRFDNSTLDPTVIRTYYQVVNSNLKLADGVRNQTLLSVAVPLTKFVSDLPKYSRNTRSVGEDARRLRGVVASAQDPQRLLFEQIPSALGIDQSGSEASPVSDIDGHELRARLAEAIARLQSALPELQKIVMGSFIEQMSDPRGEPQSLTGLRHHLQDRAARLTDVCKDPDLKPVLKLLASETPTGDEDWVLRVAGLVMKRPLESWQDGDAEAFGLRLADLHDRIEYLAALKNLLEREGTSSRHAALVDVFERVLRIQPTPRSKTHPYSKRIVDEFKHLSDDQRLQVLTDLLTMIQNEEDA